MTKQPSILAAFFVLVLNAQVLSDEKLLSEQELDPIPVPTTLPVSIAGQDCLFYLDTGSGFNLVDTSLKKCLAGPGKRKSVEVSWRPMDLEFFGAPLMRSGNWTIDAAPAAIVDLSSIRRIDGRDIRGLIGFQGLKADSIGLDFEHARLTRWAGKPSVPAGMHVVTLNRSEAGEIVPQFTVRLSDRSIAMTLDTGFNGSIELDHDTFLYLQDWGVIEPEKTYGIDFGLSGSRNNSRARFKGGFFLGMPLAGVSVVDNGLFCCVGLEVLVNFNFIFDWEGGKLYYRRRKCLPPINPIFSLGALFEFHDGKVIVSKVAPGGWPAAAAGILEGDEILSLDSIRAKDLNFRHIYEICSEKGGKTIDAEILHHGDRVSSTVKIKVRADQWVFPAANLE
jgi:hypothetical protein